ncbi:MarR family winged helix-turn-helix transcriptional regulator [Rothia uropygialis]|uniref:MarR family winged helix-turn-helix transcriptional regulator n=1 Tax=Kocuria sp. 36 TaxID=1415402 RepID=UPI00101D0444|nr:MarR family transcriptional regulator [Kocuria sp. 36]
MRQIVREHGRAGEEWIRERDISLEQGYILGYLIDHPGSIQRDVARAMHRGEANVSSMLQKLERRGLVERRMKAGNDRVKRVYATPEGAALIAGLDTAMASVDRQVLACLTVEQRSTLREILRSVVIHLDPVKVTKS